MGKKKSAPNQPNRNQQSFGNMVSRAALAQLGPQIEQIVDQRIRHLGSQLAVQQASTLETIFARVVVLENIVVEKFGYTVEDLANMVSEIEDKKEGLILSTEPIAKGNIVRLEVSTMTKDQTDYQGSSRLKIYETGTGQTIGNELEEHLLGMKAGETKEVSFGKDKAMKAKFKIDRVSIKPVKQTLPKEASDADQAQG